MLHLQPALPGDWPLWSTLDTHLPEAAFHRATREQLAYWITTGDRPIGILRHQFFWETIPFLTLLLLEAPYRGQGKPQQFFIIEMIGKLNFHISLPPATGLGAPFCWFGSGSR